LKLLTEQQADVKSLTTNKFEANFMNSQQKQVQPALIHNFKQTQTPQSVLAYKFIHYGTTI
jgi:hypothetical protein